jgi:transposase
MKRKMQHFIVENKKVYVGLEDSKRTWKISVRCEEREIDYVSMAAQYTNLRTHLKNKYPGCDITVIYEAGFRGFSLYDKLTEDGITCIVTPPSKVTQEKKNKVKTDKIDARRLATVLEKKDYKCCTIPDIERREDRQISRMLIQVQKEITREKNRIRKFFDNNGYAETFKAGAWSEQDYQIAREFELSPALKLVLNSYFEILDKLKTVQKELHKQVMVLCKKDRYKDIVNRINSTAGVGKLTAIRLVLEWGDDLGTRFRSGNALASFSGLTQSEYSTGDTIRKGRITKQGRGYIRAWLIQCSWVCIKKDPAMLSAFNRLATNTASKKKAIVAIARKLVVRIWTCVNKNVDYCIGVIS